MLFYCTLKLSLEIYLTHWNNLFGIFGFVFFCEIILHDNKEVIEKYILMMNILLLDVLAKKT